LLESSITTSHNESGRDLLTPDEVRQIGEREILVVSTNRRPMRLNAWFETRANNPAPTRALGKVIEQRFESSTPRNDVTRTPNDDKFLDPLPLID
jgi:type IV secretory pathway TraG/TraD family ATPase VirD4